jgi:hypothetical protein
MKIEGSVTAVFRDVNTGEITKSFTEKNHVTDWWLGKMAIGVTANGALDDYHYYMFGSKIFISEYDAPETDRTVTTIPDTRGVGYIESGVTSPRTTYGNSSTYGYTEHQQRFDPPASDITVRIIGLSHDTVLNADNTIAAQAWVRLSSEYIQTTTETLDVFYRITIPYGFYQFPPDLDTTKINNRGTDTILRRYTYSNSERTTYFFGYCNLTWCGSSVNVKKLDQVYMNIGKPDGDIANTYTRTYNETLKYATLHTTFSLSQGLGQLIGGMAYGARGNYYNSNGLCRFFRPMSEENDSPIQNVFFHGPNATKPFYDSTQLPAGDGRVQINGDSWTNPDYPQMFRLNITGANQYQLWVRNQFGFDNNAYRDQWRINPTMSTHNTAEFFEGFPIGTYDYTSTLTKIKRPTFIKINKTQVIAILEDDICVVDLQTGEGTRFHVSLYPSFNPTSISQVEVDPATKTIWVACRVSGLYKITDPLGTPAITLYDNVVGGSPLTPNCYGVKYGNGRLWAAFEGDIYYTTNEGTAWTPINFDTTGTEISTWDKISNLVPDPSSPDHRMAVVYWAGGGDSTDARICWWDNISGTITVGQGPIVMAMKTTGEDQGSSLVIGNKPYTYFTLLAASPTQGKFATSTRRSGYPDSYGYPAYFTFGTNTITISPEKTGHEQFNQFEIDEEGNESLLCCQYYSEALFFFKSDNTISSITYKAAADHDMGADYLVRRGAVLYMGDGVFLLFRLTDDGTQYNPQQYYLVSVGQVDDPTGGANWTHQLWKKYGWNGSSWELGHAGSKSVHTAFEPLVDGITASFDTGSFVTGDHHTVGVVDGVWLDGSTTVDHQVRLYMKPTIPKQTDVEVATLPVTVSSPDHRTTASSFTYQDSSNAYTGTDYIRKQPSTSITSCRTVNTIRKSSGSGMLDSTSMSGYIYFGMDEYRYFNNGLRILGGLSPESTIGGSNGYNDTHYGWWIDGSVEPDYNVRITIVEQGVTKYDFGVYNFDSTGYYKFVYMVLIQNDGTVRYRIHYDSTWRDVYTSATPISNENYLLSTYMAGTGYTYTSNSPGLSAIRMNDHPADDYYFNLGNELNQTGRWTPDFYLVDPYSNIDIIIDGTPAIRAAGYDDITTTLNTGEYVPFRNGQIRYSAADVGKTISASYTTMVNA